MSKPVIRTINQKRREEPEFIKYWWNVYSFDVYCAKRSNNKDDYDKAVAVLEEFEAHIQEAYPTILRKLKRPVEWS
jgi:hypothetical protein